MQKTFDEVVLFARTGLNPRQNFKLGQGNNNYITIKNIKNNALVIDGNTDVVDDEAIKLIHKRSQIKKGDILFASIGRMGDMYIIEEEPNGWDINESVFAFTLDTNIVRQKYFYYIFKVKSTVDYLVSNSSGSTFKSIKMNQLKKMVFEIPTLEEQDKIVATLDRVYNVVEMRKQELISLDNLIKARFVEMFGDPIQNTKGWNTDTCKNLTSKIGSGATPKGGRESYGTEGISLIRSMNVYNNRFEYKDLAYITDEQADKLSNVTIEENDVLLNITGASVARCCVVPKELIPARVNQHVAIVRCKDRLLPEFLCSMFTEDSYQRLLWSIATSGGATREAITKQQIEDFVLVVPPIELQQQFVNFCKQVDKSKVVVKKALDQAQLLFDSLMQEYFG